MPRHAAATQSPRDGAVTPAFNPCAPTREHRDSDYTPGGLYAPGVSDSGPATPIDISGVREPVPHDEPRSRYGNRSPYSVLGKSYRVLDSANGYVERGTASWYGNKFNGRATSSGEIYDICSFTAAHKTLPLPSFARVTNLDNGRSVIVRVNDRGPFHEGRIIDLSYAAAVRLGVDRTGTARVEVRAISVGDGPVDAPVETATPALPAPVIAAPPSVSAPASPTPSSPSSSSSSSSSSASALPSASPAATPVEGDNPSPSAPAAAADDEQRILQVGSFASQDNARRLADKLITAGIADVVIDSGEANGQPVWRVRIGPAELDALPALVDKIRALGLPSPRVFSE